jgi:hypothetical protein
MTDKHWGKLRVSISQGSLQEACRVYASRPDAAAYRHLCASLASYQEAYFDYCEQKKEQDNDSST